MRSSKAVIQLGRNCKAKKSNGLAVPAAATFGTWVTYYGGKRAEA